MAPPSTLQRGLSVLRALAPGFLPKMKRIGEKTYRQLAQEKGHYAGRLDGYRPYLGDHEPPGSVPTEARARIVYARTLAAEAERTAEIRALLDRQGVMVAPTPEAWDGIGRWIIAHIEGSREPGSAQYAPYIRDRVGDPPPKQVNGESTTQIRPLWMSVAFDLSLLLGCHMIEALPGGRWIREGERPGSEGSVLAAPLVVHEGHAVAHQPFARVMGFMRAALAFRLRVIQEHSTRLGGALRWVEEAAQTDFSLPAPEEAFIEALREQVAEYGHLPDDDDMGLLLARHGLETLPPLPRDLSGLLDERGRGASSGR